MTRAPGTRVRITNTRPEYLNGVHGTVVRPQPGEARTLVRLDGNPTARKWKAMEVCLGNSALAEPDKSDSIEQLIALKIDPACKDSAKNWMQDIARAVEHAAEEWSGSTPDGPPLDVEVLIPLLLWRFYWHLSNELRLMSEGHEQVFYGNRRER